MNPFFVQVYGGSKKPENFDTFYNLFVKEAELLMSKLLNINDQFIIIAPGRLLGDSPFLAEALAIKGHAGYYSCLKCEIEGEYYNNRVIFKEVDCPLRNSSDFKARNYIGIHKSSSLTPIERIIEDVIADTPIDYMHAVLLGIMRQLLICWITKKNFPRFHQKICPFRSA